MQAAIEQENKKTIQDIYAAFGRGDAAAILAALSPEVDWFIPGEPEIPYAGHYRGPSQVQDFLIKMAQAVDVHEFIPRDYIAQEDKVVVTGFEKMTARSTGRQYTDEWVQVWTLINGSVVEFREFFDVDIAAAAFKDNRP